MNANDLATHVASLLDGEMGPDDEGFFDARNINGQVTVRYRDDDGGHVGTFLLHVEQLGDRP